MFAVSSLAGAGLGSLLAQGYWGKRLVLIWALRYAWRRGRASLKLSVINCVQRRLWYWRAGGLVRKTGRLSTTVEMRYLGQVIDWHAIVEEHGAAVWRTARRLLGSDADASDCFQETFVSALEFSRRHEVRNFGALLTTLATSRAIDMLRRRIRRVKFVEGCSVVASSDSGPGDNVESAELVERIREALGELPSQEAAVFCLRCLNDMSYRQIGRQLGIKAGAAGVLLHRAKRRLREQLSAAGMEDEVSL